MSSFAVMRGAATLVVLLGVPAAAAQKGHHGLAHALVPSEGAPASSCTGCHVEIDFHKACADGKAAHNNLGGAGPDNHGPNNMRFAEVGTHNGEPIDLVV